MNLYNNGCDIIKINLVLDSTKVKKYISIKTLKVIQQQINVMVRRNCPYAY
jgi:hypothetical protein